MDCHENNGKLECLEKEVQRLIAESEDYRFTEYLRKMSGRIHQQKYQADLLQEELQRSYGMYLQRKKTEAEVSHAPEIPKTQISVPARGKSGEFVVGAVLLSVLGGVFVLAALVMLGMNYMNGAVWGLCLYLAAGALTAVSELLLYRRWRLLGSVLSVVGIGGLYLSTAVNCLALHNFPGWAAALITAGIMFFVILLSRKRDSALYRILGLIACYICILVIQTPAPEWFLYGRLGIIFLVNLMCILLPVKKYQTAVSIVHMAANTVFYLWDVSRQQPDAVAGMVFLASSLVILHLLFGMQVRRGGKTAGIQVAYGISVCIYLVQLGIEMELALIYEGMGITFFAAAMVGIFMICALTFLSLLKYKEKWLVYLFFNLAIFSEASYLGILYGNLLCLLLFIVTKLLCLKKPPLFLKISDGALTVLFCLEGLSCAGSAEPVERIGFGLIFAGVVIGICLISYWQSFYKLILTYTLAGFLTIMTPPILKLPVFTGVLFAGILLFNHVKRWRREDNTLFNGLGLSGQIVCFLMLMDPFYENAYLTYFCMLIFGISTVILTFQEKYHMNFRSKSMIAAIFVTYMALIVRVDYPVINSILLMLTALGSVAAGFIEKKRNIRVYGLVLSLLVCGKMILYDFVGVTTVQKPLLFFVVGVIALIIAGIYIVLEKKNQ